MNPANERPLCDEELLLIDFQTTGMHPRDAHLIEVAWCKAKDAHSTLKTTFVALPDDADIPLSVQKITGLTKDDLVDAPSAKYVIDQLACAAIGTRGVLAHYAQFEKSFLMTFSKDCKEPVFDILCTQKIARRLFTDLPSVNLRAMAGYFGAPLEGHQRAGRHVEATAIIWKNIVAALADRGVRTWSDLQAWLAQPSPARKPKLKYEYRIPKEKRLALKDQPGVYRMLSKTGEVLYVGKATSLFHRVNSYFRGRKGRDPRKLEMIAQVWDIDVTVCKTALEAALLESDEIKHFNPRYNIVLKTRDRALVFYSRDLLSSAETPSVDHPLGPFRRGGWMDSLITFRQYLVTGEMSPIFYEPIETELFEQGLQIFLQRHNRSREDLINARRLVAMGFWFYREHRRLEMQEPETQELEIDETDDTDQPHELSPDDIADKLERLLRRSAAALWRTRRLTHLLNAVVQVQEDKNLTVFDGHPLPGSTPSRDGSKRHPSAAHPWHHHDIATFDRMSILESAIQNQNLRWHRLVGADIDSVHTPRPCAD